MQWTTSVSPEDAARNTWNLPQCLSGDLLNPLLVYAVLRRVRGYSAFMGL